MRYTSVKQAPWDSMGLLMPLEPRSLFQFDRAEWRPNDPFQATAVFMGFVGGGIARFLLYDGERNLGEATMVSKYLEEVIVDAAWLRGSITAAWAVGKMGQRYTLMLADDPTTRERQQEEKHQRSTPWGS